MASRARFADGVRRLLSVLGLAAALWLGTPGMAPAQPANQSVQQAEACYGWRYYGCYSCYHAACQAANYLKACGYQACIRSCHGHYYVYYCC